MTRDDHSALFGLLVTLPITGSVAAIGWFVVAYIGGQSADGAISLGVGSLAAFVIVLCVGILTTPMGGPAND